jgi:hypothetical protein
MSRSTSTSGARRAAAWALGAIASVVFLLLALEGVLRFAPTAKGLHRANPPSSASSARLVRNQEYTFSMGWDLRHVVRGRTNSMGFISPHEYQPDARAIALIGDSFAEGEMLAFPESLAGRLDARSGGRLKAFNFGLSGASLPHYLGIAREMGSKFQLDAAVVIVVPGDYIEGFDEREGLYRWSRAGAGDVVELVPAESRGRLKQLARESALLHYVRENLKFSPSALFRHGGDGVCAPARLTGADTQRLERYIDALPQALKLQPARIVMVFNSNTREVYERVDRNRDTPEEECPSRDSLALAALRTLAAARGIQVVEVLPLLEAHYRTHRQPLDFRPVDPHWNGLATAIVADAIARRLGAPSVF